MKILFWSLPFPKWVDVELETHAPPFQSRLYFVARIIVKIEKKNGNLDLKKVGGG
jgi:hypothetical protein